MKKALILVLTLCLLLTVGCGGSPAESGGGPKDTLVWVQAADVTSLDPHVGKETPAVTVTCQIFDTLLTMDENNQPAPLLAESFENLDELTWRFKLRRDVKFHDGEPMTAEDVVFSLNRAIESPYVSYVVDIIDQAIAEDDYTVVLKTKTPYAPLLSNLTVPFTAIVPKHVVEADEEGFRLNPVGTGAYKFAEWKQGEYAKLTSNPDYFLGAPKTANLQMRVVPEASQRLIALETGEADLAYVISANDTKRIRDNDQFQLFESPSQTVTYLTQNMTKKHFASDKVRQAIRYGVNTQLIVDSMLYGSGETANSLIPPSTFGFSDKSKVYGYDIEKAKQLMAEAGYPDGFSCVLSVTDDPVKMEICQVIQNQLKEIGIDATIQVREYGTWIDELGTGSHDLSFTAWVCVTADADYDYYSLYHSSQVGYPGNDAFLKNENVDRLVMAGRETADPAERQQYYDQLEELLGDITPYTPLYYNSVNVGAGKNVEGFKVDVNGYHRLRGVAIME